MGKPTYYVEVVRAGREQDHHDYWVLGRRAKHSGEPLNAEEVSFVEAVRASNRREAVVLVGRKYPGHAIAGMVAKV
ncbi:MULTISPECIES: hypothetical protein [Lysobacter]|uniref:Uncharacterized protein n=1 Tax=Lysobacter gummosus TaxID=262324 RepID=A0ABY3XJ45_9GAMM|nr:MULTISPECIES: hypothetical protein [Lysobacter]ALN91238.1 hypothetical protein LG3211_2271 [Lysobacter gummosus]MBT2745300.1 hypothetical protein [Lysobacter sp. ISL-42]MBT2751897.1 hypothetical protein [Lysobacter sp. ISL-50]MBT2777862.1 hypothetical protein [Lysobacter sp. ISL-54]MBT2783118.1 hypothetical protein [Lysobacter sp. ISL-52]